MKDWRIPLVIITALCTSIAFAEDFKTTNGREYKNVTVIEKEPDGITVTDHKSMLVKLYFTELPKEVQERFHYDATEGDEYTRKQYEALGQLQKGALQEETPGQTRWISKILWPILLPMFALVAFLSWLFSKL